MAKLIGEWTIDWPCFASRGWPDNLVDLVSSPASAQLGSGTVDDLSATVDEDRRAIEPYLRIIPFGPNSTAVNTTIEDGDVLSFVSPRLEGGGAVEVLKQRGWHAEVCYRNDDGIAREKAPWNATPRDEPCNNGQEDWVIHIFRPRFPGVSPDRLISLKQQARLWKDIFDRYEFPSDGDQCTGSHKYLDPADFSTVTEIEGIARKLVSHPRGTMPDVPKVTCVQWAYQVLCLSLCVPLNKMNLERLGVWDTFKTNWPDMADKTPPDLNGTGKLPFIPYSPAQVLQAYLDTYAPGKSLIELLENIVSRTMLEGMLMQQQLPGLPENIPQYFDNILATGDITQPLVVPGRPPYRFVMPITFFCDARAALRKDPDDPWLQYVGTMVHEGMVKHL